MILHNNSSPNRTLLSFPTRRSSDLGSQRSRDDRARDARSVRPSPKNANHRGVAARASASPTGDAMRPKRDRKSTRLNSSHGYISYAVFCLKKNNSEE